MKTTFIYALKCPTTGALRYVGKSDNPKKRLRGHMLRATKETNHRACWLRSLLSAGLKPTMEILDEVLGSEWPQWEVAYIEFFRESGCALVNSTLGGEDPPSCEGRIGEKHPMFGKTGSLHPMFGHEHTPEAKEKIKAKRALQILTPERNAKISAAFTGEKHPMFGKQHTPQAKAKIKIARVWQTVNNRTSGRLPKNCTISIGAF